VDGTRRVAILSFAVGVTLAVTILVLNVAATPQSGQVENPIGPPPPLALGNSIDAVSGSQSWYNFSVEEVSPSLSLGRLSFDLRSSNGSALSPPPGSRVDLIAPDRTVEAMFSLGGVGTYDPGYDGNTRLTTANVISLSYIGSDPMSLQGDTLIVWTLPGACSAEIT